MKEIDIIEGNKLIGNFVDDNFFEKLGFTYSKPMFTEGRILPEHCKFYSDWNWLMAVVKKITEICSNNMYISLVHGKTKINIQFEEQWKKLFDYQAYNFFKGDIDSIYKAVIDFIKWYNKQLN